MINGAILLLLLYSSVRGISWSDEAKMMKHYEYRQSIRDVLNVRHYWSDREKIMQKEDNRSIGGSIKLDKLEKVANEVLMKYKEEEWMQGFISPGAYPANLHFFLAKPLIEGSTVFKILKQLPKGALLHTHDTGMTSFDFLYGLTFQPNLYICKIDKDFKFHFFAEPDETSCQSGTWELLADVRKKDAGIENLLNETLSLVCHDPYSTYKDINQVWHKFQEIFIKVAPLLTYKPIFEAYIQQSLQELHDDNVKYVELRTTLPNLYDLQGKIYTKSEVVRTYKEVSEKFKSTHRDFYGARIIYAPPRHVTNKTMADYVNTLHEIRNDYPEFVLGFDLVGQEDLGGPLKNFLPHLLPLVGNTSFFFHSGETDWYGSTTDENLLDAVLLGTKRIGHGYALLKHPEILKIVRDKSIAIEVAPISNQVLKLVDDMRNHPAAVLGAFGVPMVVTNDDPSYWGAKALSYDWYMAFMGIASRHDDLRYLKKLALNSIMHCGLHDDDKEKLKAQWLIDWNLFIKNLSSQLFFK